MSSIIPLSMNVGKSNYEFVIKTDEDLPLSLTFTVDKIEDQPSSTLKDYVAPSSTNRKRKMLTEIQTGFLIVHSNSYPYQSPFLFNETFPEYSIRNLGNPPFYLNRIHPTSIYAASRSRIERENKTYPSCLRLQPISSSTWSFMNPVLDNIQPDSECAAKLRRRLHLIKLLSPYEIMILIEDVIEGFNSIRYPTIADIFLKSEKISSYIYKNGAPTDDLKKILYKYFIHLVDIHIKDEYLYNSTEQVIQSDLSPTRGTN